MGKILKILTRKKVIDPASAEESTLSRVLTTFDLTALGVGSTLGVGVYVLAGHVAKDTAGPSVVLSFLIAALASVFAGLCYAEFGARAPRAGSAYIYSYVCVGEFVAFVIGWNLILEYVIGSASVARGMTEYLDMLVNNTLRNTFIDIAPINIPYLSQYFDFFSFGISVLLSIALAFGLKESSLMNNLFTVVNIFVVLFVIIAGSIKADTANWDIHPNNGTNSTIIGKGGFFPFGVEGMIKGAATCFYGFVGFDCIATTGEEVINPKKAIPISIILSLFIVFLAYFGTSTVVTLMVPYYLQNANAPIPYAFEHIGWEWAKWIVSIGGIFGLCASLFGAMLPLPRIIYAMASDNLIFTFLGKVSSRFHTPVVGTLLAGLLTGLMAAIFELKQLVNMMSIGTLLAYTMVAASVLLLRYSNEQVRLYLPVQTTSDSDDSDNTYTDTGMDMPTNTDTINDENELLNYETSSSSSSVAWQIFNCGRHKNPTKTSESIVAVEVFLYCVDCVLIGLCALFWKDQIGNGDIVAISITSVLVVIAVVLVISMVTQPTSKKELTFKVPLVPLIPAISILTNIYLMLMLDSHTWIRFAVWMTIGLPTYYFSIRPLTEAQNHPLPTSERITFKEHNGKDSFYNNIAFESDRRDNEPTKPIKKRAAPLPPPRSTEDKVEEVLKIQQEIQRLDEMLDKVANDLTAADDISIGGSLESIVAVVHRDNVPRSAESVSPSPTVNVDSPLPPDTTSSDDDTSVVDASPVPTPPSPVPTPPPSLNNSPPPQTNTINQPTAAPSSPPPLPPPEPPRFTSSNLTSVSLRHAPKSENKEEEMPRLTSSNLRSVTLRPTLKAAQIKDEEPAFAPNDDNLQVTSPKSKAFMKDLSGKLKRIAASSSYIPMYTDRKVDVTLKKETEKNENVIEDNINRQDAKDKLLLFVASRVENGNNKVKETEPDEVVEALSETPVDDHQVEEATEDDRDDYMVHRNRMKNVFRSINLARGEALNEPIADGARNIKSLGHAEDDRGRHRQAMSEIFKNEEA